ncbi:hypothetical protein M0805_006132 [Coniferiporia weirii]|nr:hypothetical protein M0805_006132 [Coniferiporia weirii]
MNPAHPPIPPYSTRTYSSDATANSLYGVHVNTAARRMHPRANTSPSSFYPSHLNQHTLASQPPLPTEYSTPPPLPPSLMPGSRVPARNELLSSFENSLFFQSVPPNPPSPGVSPTDTSIHPYARMSSPSRPTLPPKPPPWTYPSAGPSRQEKPKIPPKVFGESRRLHAPDLITQTSSPLEDNDELVARVLELSLQDMGPTGRHESEDEILARVLEESMAPMEQAFTQNRATPASQLPTIDTTATTAPASFPSTFSTSSLPLESTEEPSPSVRSNSSKSNCVNKGKSRLSAGSSLDELDRQGTELIKLFDDEFRRRQLETDEELARSIARDEELNAKASSAHPSLPSPSKSTEIGTTSLPSTFERNPPPYRYAMSAGRPSSFNASLPQRPSLGSHALPSTPGNGNGSRPHLPRGTAHLSLPERAFRSVGVDSFINPSSDRLGRSTSAQAAFSSITEENATRTGVLDPKRSSGSSIIVPPNAAQSSQDSISLETDSTTPKVKPKASLAELPRGVASVPVEGTSLVEDPSEHEPSPISGRDSMDEQERGQLLSASATIVEEELLVGISFGFNAPSLDIAHRPMQGPIPNIITLPYGKCPPLHIQAPNWKQLLKLLTRLSESRIEPTVEALAGTKSELRLRTVLQFVKVHHSSSDWRTIVYLSIDVPVPQQLANGFKYTNGDVSIFPYSYISSPLPALLRAGAGDSDLAKCFTVPATTNTPYPKLPLALPDYAMYLHSVLEDSRRAANDSSGGLRRLAKMVDSFYPQVANGREGLGMEADVPGRKGVGGFFKRALGRGERNQAQRGGNADTYEFITPFRIDEYR